MRAVTRAPQMLCKPDQRCKLGDERIAAVLQVEFERLRQIYGGAPRSPAVRPRKRHRGALEQEDAADSAVDVARDPEALPVAADEERRDRLVDDIGIERPKRAVAVAALTGAAAISGRRPGENNATA